MAIVVVVYENATATLESQRVSEFLAELEYENCYRSFFRAYAPCISNTLNVTW
ncbi:hypothetical protein [Butyrivibrio fibrisolvens]|uniref:hypothetical protein n=1 Tax=Butyrivibrio fibrisolvens TaxID=831 RepID=UPI000407AA45|nr:hypothetical protein [Butyrivibrio fibrisolvens]